MKKILLFLAVFCFCFATFGQTLINESFDGATFPPTGWTNIQVSGTGTSNVWDRVTSGIYPTCIPHSGVGMVRYNSYNYSNNTAAILVTPVIDLTAVGTNTANVTFWMYRDNDYPTNADSVDVYISNSISPTGATHLGNINRNMSLTPIEPTEGWYQYSFTIPGSYNGATNYVIFKATSQYGNNMFIDDVNVKISALNDAGIFSIDSPPAIVNAGLYSIDATIKNYGVSNLTATNIGWSVNGAIQTPNAWSGNLATGSTDGPFNVGNYSFASGTYTVKVWTVSPNGYADGDAVNDTISKVVYVQGYASLPYNENFDGVWIDKMDTRDVPSGFWANTPVSGSNSWRRDDDGTAAAWYLLGYGDYSPNGADATAHSAKFHSYGAASGTTGILDLYLDFSTPGNKVLSFWYVNPTGSDSLDVYISGDNGATFSFLQQFIVSANWTWQQISLGSPTDANTILRFKATSDYGVDDLGIDEVSVSIPAANDVGVTGILSPLSKICGNANDSVIVLVHNFGTNNQSDIPVKASIITPGGPVILTDTLAGPLGPDETDTLYLGSINTLTPFDYEITAYTDLLTDNVFSNDTSTWTFTINAILSVPHIEDFDGSNPAENWSGSNFAIGNGHGNSSNVLYTDLWSSYPVAAANMTKKLGPLTANSYFSFDYRITNYSGGGATTLGTDTIVVFLSPDCGNSFTPVYLINSVTHLPSTAMRQIKIPVGVMAGQEVIPVIYCQRGTTGDFYIDFDNIAVSEPPVVDLGPDAIYCTNSAISLDAGGAPSGYTYLYSWSTLNNPTSFASSQTITTDSSATYIVAVNNGFGLITTDTIVITILPIPVVDLGPAVSACGSHTLDAGNAGSFYNWSTGEMTQTISITMSDTYTLTVTNATGCSATDDIHVTIIPLPSVDAGPDYSLCYLDTLHLMNTIATNYDSLLWTSTGNGHFNDSTLLHPYYIVGSDDIINGMAQLILTAFSFCDTVSSAMILNISMNALASAGNDVTICPGNSTQLQATGGTSYVWTPSTGLSDATIQNPVASPAATTTYTVHVTSACGIASDDVTVTVNQVAPVNLGPDINLCNDTLTTMLDAGISYASYLWSTGETTQTINVAATGIYTITATDSIGCSSVDVIEVHYWGLPVVHIYGDTLACTSNQIVLTADPGYSVYLWDETTPGTDQFNAHTSGNYWVNVTDLNGCSANSDTLNLTIYNLHEIDLGPDVTIHLTEYVILDASHGYDHYSWNLGANTQTLTVYGSDLGIGYHTVWAAAWMEEDCYSSDSIIIHVINNTGIDEWSDGSGLSVYPNPANDYADIVMPDSWKGADLRVSLMDITGRCVKQMNVAGASSFRLDLYGITPGMYHVVVRNGDRQSNIKLIIE